MPSGSPSRRGRRNSYPSDDNTPSHLGVSTYVEWYIVASFAWEAHEYADHDHHWALERMINLPNSAKEATRFGRSRLIAELKFAPHQPARPPYEGWWIWAEVLDRPGG